MFRDFEVDHILNESLEVDPEKRSELVADYGLQTDFSINSFENWASSHKHCNRMKSDATFNKNSALYFLLIADKKAKKARAIYRALERENNVAKVRAQLRVLIENGKITPHEIADFANSVVRNADIGLNNPVVVCFGLSFDDFYMMQGVEPYSPIDVESLETDLVTELRAKMETHIELLESQFNGETLTVRYAIWDFDLDKFDKVDFKWWEILESGLHTQIYEECLQDDE